MQLAENPLLTEKTVEDMLLGCDVEPTEDVVQENDFSPGVDCASQ